MIHDTRYIFFGTPRFAAITLQKLIAAGAPPAALVCNPDKPIGRKQVITPPPTKEIAARDQRLGIRVFQPETKEELIKISDQLFQEADFGVVAAYAMIIPKEALEKPKLGIIGVHPSLLPRYRGATPIQSAVLAGEKETGVTLFLMDGKVDHGPVLAHKKLTLSPQSANSHELADGLAELGAELLIETLPRFVKGEIIPVPQEESEATYTSKFSAEDGYIDPDDLKEAIAGNAEKAQLIDRKVRALNPEPGVYTILEDKRTKILLTEIRDGKLILKRIQRAGGKPTDLLH